MVGSPVKSQSSNVRRTVSRKSYSITDQVLRRTGSSVSSNPSIYTPERWELEPKTDYTYAHSKSYRTGTPKNKCVSPNLARPSRFSPGVVGQSQYDNGSERAMLAFESAEYNQSQVDGGEETSLWVKFLVLVWTVIVTYSAHIWTAIKRLLTACTTGLLGRLWTVVAGNRMGHELRSGRQYYYTEKESAGRVSTTSVHTQQEHVTEVQQHTFGWWQAVRSAASSLSSSLLSLVSQAASVLWKCVVFLVILPVSLLSSLWSGMQSVSATVWSYLTSTPAVLTRPVGGLAAQQDSLVVVSLWHSVYSTVQWIANSFLHALEVVYIFCSSMIIVDLWLLALLTRLRKSAWFWLLLLLLLSGGLFSRYGELPPNSRALLAGYWNKWTQPSKVTSELEHPVPDIEIPVITGPVDSKHKNDLLLMAAAVKELQKHVLLLMAGTKCCDDGQTTMSQLNSRLAQWELFYQNAHDDRGKVIAALQQKLTELTSLFKNGAMDVKQWADKVGELQNKVQQVTASLQNNQSQRDKALDELRSQFAVFSAASGSEGEKVGAWAADHSRQQEVLQQSLDLLTSQVKQLQSTATQDVTKLSDSLNSLQLTLNDVVSKSESERGEHERKWKLLDDLEGKLALLLATQQKNTEASAQQSASQLKEIRSLVESLSNALQSETAAREALLEKVQLLQLKSHDDETGWQKKLLQLEVSLSSLFEAGVSGNGEKKQGSADGERVDGSWKILLDKEMRQMSAQLTAQLEAEKSASSLSYVDLQQQLTALAAQVKAFSAESGEKTEKLADMENTLSSLHNKLQELTASVAAVESLTDQLHQLKADAKTYQIEHSGRLETLTLALQAAETAVQQVQDKGSLSVEDLSDLRGKLADVTKRFETRILELESATKQWQDKMKEELEKMATEKSSEAKLMAALQVSVDYLQSKHKLTEDLMSSQAIVLATLQQTTQQMGVQINESQAEKTATLVDLHHKLELVSKRQQEHVIESVGGTAAKVDWSSVEDSLYSKVKADLAVMAEDMRKKLEAGQEKEKETDNKVLSGLQATLNDLLHKHETEETSRMKLMVELTDKVQRLSDHYHALHDAQTQQEALLILLKQEQGQLQAEMSAEQNKNDQAKVHLLTDLEANVKASQETMTELRAKLSELTAQFQTQADSTSTMVAELSKTVLAVSQARQSSESTGTLASIQAQLAVLTSQREEEHTDRDAAVKTLNGKLADLQLKTTNDLEVKAAVLKHLQESLDALSNRQLASEGVRSDVDALQQSLNNLLLLHEGLAKDVKNVNDQIASVNVLVASSSQDGGRDNEELAVLREAVHRLNESHAASSLALTDILAQLHNCCGRAAPTLLPPIVLGADGGDDFRAFVLAAIDEAVAKYDADKTGLADYALESAGGSVISVRCSETYEHKTALVSLWKIPLWYVVNSPRTVIQPTMQPGDCWPLKGAQGQLVIQLSYIIRPTAFSYEHISSALSPGGNVTSAPKDFSVWGLHNETDTQGVLLGEYTYTSPGRALQTFPVANPSASNFGYVELKIHSNHGHALYTCLYRFRVHGVPIIDVA